MDKMHLMVDALLKYETIDSKDLKLILEGQKLTRPINNNKRISRKPAKKYKARKSIQKKQLTQTKLNKVPKKTAESKSIKK